MMVKVVVAFAQKGLSYYYAAKHEITSLKYSSNTILDRWCTVNEQLTKIPNY